MFALTNRFCKHIGAGALEVFSQLAAKRPVTARFANEQFLWLNVAALAAALPLPALPGRAVKTPRVNMAKTTDQTLFNSGGQ